MDDALNLTWFSDEQNQTVKEVPPYIVGHRRMEHADILPLENLTSLETYKLFGDFNLGKIYEASCFSIVQYNHKNEVISGMCLCNYPNVPSVPPEDWSSWINNIYGMESVTAMNALFVHFLVWDKRYDDSEFFEDFLAGLFKLAIYCLHVILVHPPRVMPGVVYQEKMTRVLAKGISHSSNVQSVYTTSRYLHSPFLRNRRLVEEDNDDVIKIIDAETSLLKNLYGEYYISEMVRYPDGNRQLVVSEDNEGLATGIMCLNCALDIDVLNEHFELIPYNGLRKPHENDSVSSFQPPSELFAFAFAHQSEESVDDGLEEYADTFSEDDYSREENLRSNIFEDEGMGEYDPDDRLRKHFYLDDAYYMADTDSRNSLVVQMKSTQFNEPSKPEVYEKEYVENSRSQATTKVSFPASLDVSQMTFINYLPSPPDYLSLYYHSRARTDVPGYALPQRDRTDTQKSIPSEAQYPTYHGEPNVFALEIFAARPEIAQMYTRNFIEASFECYPNLDYCIVLVPFTHQYFSFLEQAVRVPLKCNKDFPRTLYVTHRAALFGTIKSRRGKKRDEEEVRELLHSIPLSGSVLRDFNLSVCGRSHLESYVFKCSDKLFGVVILCNEKHPEYLKRRYHIEDFIVLQNIPHYAHKRILHFVVMPIFSIYHRDLLREVCRLSGAIVLYYRLCESDHSALTRSHPLITCLSAMTPVKPRRRIQYEFRGYKETDEIPEKEHFSLFLTTPRLTTFPISIFDTRIVIVGASDCGVALAEELTLGSIQHFMHFTNVTLISPHGLPYEIKRSDAVLRMVPYRGRYSQDYRNLAAIRSCINIIYGTVDAINRRKKHVTVKDRGKISYDYLILTCGLQYQKPMLEEERHAEITGDMVPFEKPWNCLTVNNDSDAYTSLEKLQRIMRGSRKKSIVFYGHNIDCYCALHGLLEFGIDGSLITLVDPPLLQCEKHDDVFFNDCEVDSEIMRAIIQSGVTILFGYALVDWILVETPNKRKMIDSLLFEVKGQRKRVPCSALFDFYEKTINASIFLAICKTGLVFDGHLVIDPECRTNDPCVFAAGTMTKYSRKFYADAWQHKYYNSVEIGERLAKSLRTVIDVDQSEPEVTDNTPKVNHYPMLPIFREPIIIACTLPGGHYYLHVRKAGRRVFRNTAVEHNVYGQVLVTGSCQSDIGYFRIRLNTFDSVETVTCLNKKVVFLPIYPISFSESEIHLSDGNEFVRVILGYVRKTIRLVICHKIVASLSFEVHHMIALYGKHEALLNELKLQFRNSLIVDFFAYFREPWATVLFYDKFECLRVENRETLLSKLSAKGEYLVEDCVKALKRSNWEAMSKEDRRDIQEKFPGSVYHLELEDSLAEFLQCFEDDLPMYWTPDRKRLMYAGINYSPLYNCRI